MRLPLFLVLGLLSLSQVKAANVVLDSLVGFDDPSTTDYVIRNSGLTNLSSGRVSIGVFASLTDAQVASSSLSALLAPGVFTEFAFDDFIAGPNAAYGGVSAGITHVDGSFTPTSYVGKTFYIFIGNGSSLSGSSEHALLRSDLAVILDGTSPAFSDLKFANATTIYGTKSGGGVYNGTPFPGFGLDSSVSAQAITLVPEPSVALLGGLGVLGLVARRRRD